MVFIVGMMSLFTWIFQSDNENSNDKKKIIRSQPEIIGFYTVYIINILTNHGMPKIFTKIVNSVE